MITPNMIISEEDMEKFILGFSYKKPEPPPPSRLKIKYLEKGKSMLDSFREWQHEQEPTDDEIRQFGLEKLNSVLGEFNIQMFKEMITLHKRIDELENQEEEDDSD